MLQCCCSDHVPLPACYIESTRIKMWLHCVAVLLQCAAVCCSVLQCVAVCCSVSQRVAACRSVLQHAAACSSVLPCVEVRCSVLQCFPVQCSVLQSCCRVLQCEITFRQRCLGFRP